MRLRYSDLSDRLLALGRGACTGLVCYRLYVSRAGSGYNVTDSVTRKDTFFRHAREAALFVMSRNRAINQELR